MARPEHDHALERALADLLERAAGDLAGVLVPGVRRDERQEPALELRRRRLGQAGVHRRAERLRVGRIEASRPPPAFGPRASARATRAPTARRRAPSRSVIAIIGSLRPQPNSKMQSAKCKVQSEKWKYPRFAHVIILFLLLALTTATVAFILHFSLSTFHFAVRRFSRQARYASMTAGMTEITMMTMVTTLKWSWTISSRPNEYPASTRIVTQPAPPMTL